MSDGLSIELTEEMVDSAVAAFFQMATLEERPEYEARDIVVGVIQAAFRAQSSGPQVHYQGQLGNWLFPPGA